MNVARITNRISLVLVCLLVLTLTSLPAGAQILDKAKEGVQKGVHGVHEGAEAVGKGVKKGAQETKEGAEAVGRGAKKAVTGEDREKGTEYQTQPATPAAPGTQPSGTTAPMGKKHMAPSTTRHKGLPRTAGEFPLLALSGVLALAGAAVTRTVRRRKSD